MVTKNDCPCGSKLNFDNCCGQYISGAKKAPTAEALMRARYSAYATHNIDYVESTHDPKSTDEFDRAAAKTWAEQTQWLGLEVQHTEEGQAGDETGVVEFIARFRTNGKDFAHHEVSLFRQENGTWYYVDGKTVNTPFVRTSPKLGRNDPCHCGSGKKFKKCCAAGTAAGTGA